MFLNVLFTLLKFLIEFGLNPALTVVCLFKYILFVCLFDRVNRSVPTTIDSGLHGPQGPFSTLWAIGAFFYKIKRVE